MTTQNMARSNFIGGALGLALMATLTGCPSPVVNNVSATAPVVQAQPAVVEQPVVVAQPAVVEQPVVVAQPVVVVDTSAMIYYPTYEVYFDPGARVYWHSDRGRWVSGGAPEGVSVAVLQSSPSARMNFHGSPESHHAVVAQQYPRNWKPQDAPNRGQGPPDRGQGQPDQGRNGRGN